MTLDSRTIEQLMPHIQRIQTLDAGIDQLLLEAAREGRVEQPRAQIAPQVREAYHRVKKDFQKAFGYSNAPPITGRPSVAMANTTTIASSRTAPRALATESGTIS